MRSADSSSSRSCALDRSDTLEERSASLTTPKDELNRFSVFCCNRPPEEPKSEAIVDAVLENNRQESFMPNSTDITLSQSSSSVTSDCKLTSPSNCCAAASPMRGGPRPSLNCFVLDTSGSCVVAPGASNLGG